MTMQDAGAVPVLDPEDRGTAPDIAAEIEKQAEQVTLSLLRACDFLAKKAGGAEDTREAAEAAKAALALAQAIVVLDPELDGQGTPIAHQIALATAQAKGQIAVERERGTNALAAARERASAPTPARSVQVTRDQNGRAASYDVTGA